MHAALLEYFCFFKTNPFTCHHNDHLGHNQEIMPCVSAKHALSSQLAGKFSMINVRFDISLVLSVPRIKNAVILQGFLQIHINQQ